jgi:putative membrane protein
MQKNIIITLFFSIIITVFALLNSDPIAINLAFGEVDISVALVILISATLGAVLVYSLATIAKIKAKKKLKLAEEALLDMTKECQKLEEKLGVSEVDSVVKEETIENIETGTDNEL